ncbi:hypothetical protein CRG98_046122 [Punica granatum]|uniref:Dynamin-type G domain-containing protein n=1 Tax=Punica granatum TaxID=22663 RepID=A0A2I0HPI3_PUNGR|nr:hypothetical protein CRG98_046122 [Punica granatum]
MPKVLSTVAEAMTAFMQIMGSAKDSLRKILLRGEYDEYPHEKQMHGTARFVEMLDRFANELRMDAETGKNSSFLMEEISLLEEAKGIRLPNFIPRTAFLTILHKKVEDISCKPFKFMGELWDYIELVVITVLMDHSKNYPPLQACMRRAAQNLIGKMKERAMIRVTDIIEMEKLTDYTCDPEYISEWNQLMEEEPKLLAAIDSYKNPSTVSLEGIGEVEIDSLRQFKHHLKQAFDLKVRMTSYWKIVLRRLVDTMATFLLFNVQVLVNKEMEVEMVNDLVGPHGDGIERMPILDAVDRLRNLQVMKEGIQLPTIVVVGDQSSGKSSVLESLAGINLPRGQGICTRVPLIMRLQNHPCPDPELYLEFNGKHVETDEDNKGISNTPLTLVVKKDGVPDLTMVDLPGITRVPVHGQPENIYEQISEMIMEYIRPEESIILNVLSATVDFSTCESIRMSQMVDKTGHRTLAVVTKSDKAPEGLLEKVTADDVNIGLGYVCVRNRIGDETYEEARMEEAKLFDAHPLLSKIDKRIVGIPVLSEKLIQIQATIVAKCLPEIMKERAMIRVTEIIEMEKLTDYTCDPEYISEWNKLMGEEPKLLAAVNNESFERPSAVSLEGIGVVEIDPLRQLKHQVKQAFDLKMRMTSYWKIVKRRLVDTMAMFLLFNVQVLVNREMEGEIVNDLVGPHGGRGNQRIAAIPVNRTSSAQ